ncbi:hypothetical protein ENBRE01_2382 [Enteropsectra breve]|nr:hypothetical protein ENBRE01_2382 [Enteropsectra breve]
MKKIKKILIPRYYKKFKQLGGPNIKIEVEESKFGKRKYNKGHCVDGVWVLGFVERKPQGHIMMLKT